MSEVQPTPVAGEQRHQVGGGLRQKIARVIWMAVFCYLAMKIFSLKKLFDEPMVFLSNTFSKGDPMDMWLYLTEDDKFNDFSNEDALYWHEKNIPYGVWGPTSTRKHTLTYYPSEALKHNGSLYAHVFFARSGYPADPADPEYDPKSSFGGTHPVVAYLRKSKNDKKKSLLDEASPKEVDSKIETKEGPVEHISYWKPNITINLLDDVNQYLHNNIPSTISGHLKVDIKSRSYFPIMYFNDFWLLRDKLIAVNETVDELPLNLQVGPISLSKWLLFYRSFLIHRSYGSMLEQEADELKRVFLEGNPCLLAITTVVSLLFTLFDFLVFKNYIQSSNKNKPMEGLLVKSVVLDFICEVVIFLYLLDNEASWMILVRPGVGICIEFWKLGKAMHLEFDGLLKFRYRPSYTNNKTEYDDTAMKYLTYVLYFLALCFAGYSLKYDKHKSWYSWMLSSLTSYVYIFGFVMMCPELFMNYKLKSVAHMRWTQITYKFLITIIDDLFAFIFKIPLLHRLSVFRNDIIFLIYLYQSWKYPVDRKRVNEFEFRGEEEETQKTQIMDGTQKGDKKTN